MKNLKKIEMKPRYTIIVGLLLLIVISTSGCRKYPRIEGNNQMESEKRVLVAFDKVKCEAFFNVYIRDDSIFSATVEAESNLIPHIRTIVNGNTLVIDTRENLRNNMPINIYVAGPTIHGAILSGSGMIQLDSIITDFMEIELSGSGKISGYIDATNTVAKISGSGDINLENYTNSMDARISGSGNLDLFGTGANNKFTISGSGQIRSYSYEQGECEARISGSGDMFLNVIENLIVNISGSGSVYYIGDPSLSINITGSGNVFKQ
jgi:hypothetical protein